MKQISTFILGFVTACASAPAPAQDLTAGKTPAQLFRSDCAECHRSPNGLGRNRDVRTLADFLREHYTTKSETAGALAAYVAGFAVGGAAARNGGTGAGAPATGERTRAERRKRGEGAATGDDARTNAGPFEDPTGRRRRTTSLSGDGDKRRIRSDGEVPRPPGDIVTTPAAPKSNARERDSAPRDATDPVSRLRSYLSSGLDTESASMEAAKTGAPKARKRRNRADKAEPPAPDGQATVKTHADAPPAASLPATIDPTAPAGPAATPPRLEQ